MAKHGGPAGAARAIQHPGAYLMRHVVLPSGVSLTRLAAHIGVTRQAVSTLLNGRCALSPDMAVRFEMAFGIDAGTMLRMQVTWDLAEARAGAIGVERLVV